MAALFFALLDPISRCALFPGESTSGSWSKTSKDAEVPLALLAPLRDEVGEKSPFHSLTGPTH